jgi:extracellular elastinolytic metalloproteinase
MRVSALLALLPALATLASAAPTTSAAPRKSLSFGPSHPHHKFESFPDTPAFIKRAIEEDPKRAAAKFIAHRTGATEGEGFFIREDVSASILESSFLQTCIPCVERSALRVARWQPNTTRGSCQPASR